MGKFSSGASKRKRLKLQKEVTTKTRPITDFIRSTAVQGSSQDQECTSDNEVLAVTSNHSEQPDALLNTLVSISDIPSSSNDVTENVPVSVVNIVASEEDNSVTTPSLIDIGLCNSSNRFNRTTLLKIDKFTLPDYYPKDRNNCSFPTRLFTATLTNGERCNRDWMCWSEENKSLYCAPCFFFQKSDSGGNLSSLARLGYFQRMAKAKGSYSGARKIKYTQTKLYYMERS